MLRTAMYLWGQPGQGIHNIFLLGIFDIPGEISVFAWLQRSLQGSCAESCCWSLLGSKSPVGRGRG